MTLQHFQKITDFNSSLNTAKCAAEHSHVSEKEQAKDQSLMSESRPGSTWSWRRFFCCATWQGCTTENLRHPHPFSIQHLSTRVTDMETALEQLREGWLGARHL